MDIEFLLERHGETINWGIESYCNYELRLSFDFLSDFDREISKEKQGLRVANG